jgi:hypothetical protein
MKYETFVDDMKVPLYLPGNPGKWVIEIRGCFGELKKTVEPNQKEAEWIKNNPVRALDLNAEFHNTYNRKYKEVVTAAQKLKKKS